MRRTIVNMPSPELHFHPEPLDSPVVQGLIAALNAELTERYPEDGANHFQLVPAEVAPGQGTLLVAYRGAEAVGCGALRRLDAHTGELKRMYVQPTSRGLRVGKGLLEALETAARSMGLRRLVLETGGRQHEAVALYQRAGFVVIPPFGAYVDSPLSLCMAKNLA